MNNLEFKQDSTEIRETDWVMSQVKEELKELEKETFYTKDGDKINYDLWTVKSYLDSIKDKSWDELVANNSSAWIMAVQIALESFKDSSGSQLYDVWIIDGHYGWSTKSAVRKFQKENNLTVDDAPGSNTIKAILWKLEGTSSNQHGNMLGEVDTSSEQSPTLTEAPKVDINILGSWEGQNFVFKQWIEKKDQQGTYIELDGKKYYAYKEGMNGLGYENYIWREVFVYLGEYKNGKKEWKWTTIWEDGDRYEWEYKNGEKEWKWTMISANGNSYEWEYKNGVREWKWTYTWANGDKYEWDWKNWKKEWKWTYTRANGNRYKWEWKNGGKEWRWTLIKADRTKYKQIYKDNELKWSRKIIF